MRVINLIFTIVIALIPLALALRMADPAYLPLAYMVLADMVISGFLMFMFQGRYVKMARKYEEEFMPKNPQGPQEGGASQKR